MFALDTNTLIYFFKNAGQVKDRFLATPPAEIAVPSIVLYELELGIMQSSQTIKRRAQLDTLLRSVRILMFDEAAAKISAQAEATLRAAGTPIGPKDILIAGTVLATGATLVTHNIREFQRVRGLKIVDWY